MLDKNMSLYALSKLTLRNHDSFFKYLLLLSCDVNLNPGPIQNPCKKCLGSVNKKVIFVKVVIPGFTKNVNYQITL